MKELEAFEAWWSAQETGLGTAHRFTAWNAWLAHAAVEAERAQRVPDWETRAEIAEQQVVCLSEELDHFRDLYTKLLASTPAPAQQEPSDATIAQIDREIEAMLTQVESGSFPEFPARTLELAREVAKLIVAKHQEPPHQERKPMTYREIADATREWAHVRSDYTIGIIRAAERHHGIKE